jgi:hypothetical protein
MVFGFDMVPDLWHLGLAWTLGLSVVARRKTLGPGMIARPKLGLAPRICIIFVSQAKIMVLLRIKILMQIC